MLKILKPSFAILAVVFLLAPLLAIMPLAFTSSVFLTYPLPGVSLRWFDELLTADAWRRAIGNTLVMSVGTALLATVLGTLGALGLRGKLPLGGVFRTLFLLPMVVPAVVLGVGMQLLFGRMGISNTYLGVIVAHTVVAVPFVLVSVSGALAGIDPRVERAALSLGAPPVTVFWRVTLPLAAPGVVSGAVLAFATSLDEVVLTLFVAGPNQRTLARQMFSTIRENISPAIAAAAFVFILGTLVLAALVLLLRRRTATRMKTAAPN
jgi:putative spermidine/putrescine transport system permease protein